MKLFRGICFLICLGVILVVPTLVLPRVGLGHGLGLVQESQHSGVLMLYHVETFEGGSSSRGRFLEKAAQSLESREPNLFVLVRTVDPVTLIQLLSEGAKPDLISFGSGLGEPLRGILTDVGDDFGALSVFADSGVVDGKQLAVPYMAGGYALIGDSALLKSAGVADDTSLRDCVGISFKSKNKEIPALVVGGNKYIDPKSAFMTNSEVMPQYTAYENFVANRAAMLLGTQRDINRLIAREQLGRGHPVRVEYIDTYTDLVQYIGITAIDPSRQAAARVYVQHLLSANVQNDLASTGMISVTGKKIYSGMLGEMESALTSPNLRVKDLF